VSGPEVTVRTSRYTVTCVPADSAPDAYVWALHVEEKRDGNWVVTDGFGYLNPDLVFEDRPYPQCLFPVDTALALAKEAAPLVIINGRTVTQALELADAWRAQNPADAVARSKEQQT
jgi:hypothetical protein